MGIQGTGRIGIFRDDTIENAFVVIAGRMVFARLNRIGNKWCVWFCKKHLQKEFLKIRDALSEIEKEFISWYWKGNEIH